MKILFYTFLSAFILLTYKVHADTKRENLEYKIEAFRNNAYNNPPSKNTSIKDLIIYLRECYRMDKNNIVIDLSKDRSHLWVIHENCYQETLKELKEILHEIEEIRNVE